MNPDDIELKSFLERLKKRKPTEFMMIWMKYYNNICERECCFSPDCGSIKCSFCKTSLTTIPPKSRFQCIECEIPPPDVIYNTRPEVCEKCYYNSLFLHNHSMFLKIDEIGVHTIDRREIGISTLKKLELNDFKIITKKIVNNDCLICCSEFTDQNPAVSYPGCINEHGSPGIGKQKEIFDSLNYCHGSCLMNWYKISNKDKYCGNILFCEVCIFEEELGSWRNLFERAKVLIDSSINLDNNFLGVIAKVESILTLQMESNEINDIISENLTKEKIAIFCRILKEKLNYMHPQVYIQNLVNEVFNC